MAAIPALVDWVEDVCWMNLVSVAQQQNKLYYVGGYSVLRSQSIPTRGGTQLANSHLYAADFSEGVDLQKNSSAIFTVTRLPDVVPRISSGNFLWRESSLILFGGAQTIPPIFLANGSFSLADRATIGDGLFRDDISNGSIWYRNSSFDYGGTQKTSIGLAAKAFDWRSDNGKGVLWFYGGGYWEDQYKVGMNTKGTKLDMVEFEDLWRIPCGAKSVVACRLDTRVSGRQTVPRGNLNGTMVWVDAGAQGLLVLFGGSFRGVDVSMRDVHVYDIANSTWHRQRTTADLDHFPSDRTDACAVAATAPDRSSYNIYVHGGYTNSTYSNSVIVDGGAWILTLPTFHWIRSSIGYSHARAGHTCAKIHEKFMVVHRGVAAVQDSNCDENAGLAIMDLVTLDWVTKIDVSGGVVYQVPELVSNVIGGDGTGGATYNSPQGGFENTSLSSVFQINSASPLNGNPEYFSPSPPSPPSTYTIAAGILGGIVLVTVILPSIYLLLILGGRRKQLEKEAPHVELPSTPGEMTEVDAREAPGGMPEMAAREPPGVELPDCYCGTELPDGHGHREGGKEVQTGRVHGSEASG